MIKKNIVIGIDLGTTNSCVAICDRDVTVLPNESGNYTTPSVVAYKSKGEVLVGAAACRDAARNPKAVVAESKRLIGRSFKEDANIIKQHSEHSSYKVVNKDNRAFIHVVPAHGEAFDVSPEEVGAKILMHLKKVSSQYLGEEVDVTKAVITVPSYFNDAQRQATRDAAEIAGLEVLRLVNEPTAAALAYFSKSFTGGEQNVAVYDLGGGTFDISILQISKDGDDPLLVEVKASKGNTFLGGSDVDSVLFKHLKILVAQQCSSLDLESVYISQRLYALAENTKKELSVASSVTLSESFGFTSDNRAIIFETTITRATLESLARPIIDQTRAVCRAALDDAAKSDITKIHQVLMVGGMTRMPLVEQVAKEIFQGATIKKDLNPDQVVAMGAAIQGAIILGNEADAIGHQMLLSDVAPLSLGVEVANGAIVRMIERNTTVPTQVSQIYTTAVDNQTQVDIKIYQGERPMAADNKLLGQFVLHGLKPMPRGRPQIEITFEIDANGLVKVTAADKETGVSQNIKIENATSMDKAEKERLIREAEEYSKKDAIKLEIAKAISVAEGCVYDAQNKLKEYGDKISDEIKDEVHNKCTELETPLGSLRLQSSRPNFDPEGARDLLEEVQNKSSELTAAITKASGAGGDNTAQPQSE